MHGLLYCKWKKVLEAALIQFAFRVDLPVTAPYLY